VDADLDKLTDAELLTLAVMQALLGYVSEARWLRYARTHLHGLFAYLPGQSGYNKRLRAAFPLFRYFIRALVIDTPRAARPWPAGLPTAIAAPTPASSGGCGCTWSVPCTACRLPSRWPIPKLTSVRSWSSCWTSNPGWRALLRLLRPGPEQPGWCHENSPRPARSYCTVCLRRFLLPS
jgi:hypothetical protein